MERLSESVDSYDIRVDILNNLANQFIYNAPSEELDDDIKLLFRVEKAYWHYVDKHCDDRSVDKVKYNIKPFASLLLQNIPFLCHRVSNLKQMLTEFNLYKKKIPNYGAILISANKDKVLLVQNYWQNSDWAFPKGKAKENEDPFECAIREVGEETGFNISTLARPDLYIEATYMDRYTRLYIAYNVPEDAYFAPRTQCEVLSCKWFDMRSILTSKGYGKQCIIEGANIRLTGNTFMMKKKLHHFLTEQSNKDKRMEKQEAKRKTTRHRINRFITLVRRIGRKIKRTMNRMNLYKIIIFIFIFCIFAFFAFLYLD